METGAEKKHAEESDNVLSIVVEEVAEEARPGPPEAIVHDIGCSEMGLAEEANAEVTAAVSYQHVTIASPQPCISQASSLLRQRVD